MSQSSEVHWFAATNFRDQDIELDNYTWQIHERKKDSQFVKKIKH